MKASILEFWVAGCIVTKHDLGRSKHVGLRRFREHFGTTPNICEIVWNLLDDQELHPTWCIANTFALCIAVSKVIRI